MLRTWFAILPAVTLTSCSILGLGEERVVGVIALDVPNLVPVMAPDSVAPGASFSTTVSTVGGGCTRADGIEVTYSSQGATLVPYDLISRDDNCTSGLQYLRHAATLRFETPGAYRLRVVARDAAGLRLELEYPLRVY